MEHKEPYEQAVRRRLEERANTEVDACHPRARKNRASRTLNWLVRDCVYNGARWKLEVVHDRFLRISVYKMYQACGTTSAHH